MKKILYMLAFAAFLDGTVLARPLTIINKTGYATKVHLIFSMTNTSLGKVVQLHKRVKIGPNGSFVYELHEQELCESVIWRTFGKLTEADAWQKSNYSIAFKEELPRMQHGGVLIISRGGSYMYDNKQGKKNSVGFGKAGKVDEL